ncbi:MAG TPA: DUF488 family protein [Tepidisphaeraceae bacterium]|jgi:uncharacterized protein YeaO (DUF488 family)
MFKVKSLFDAVELDDGLRLWVEPVGLTKDLTEWCEVHHSPPGLAPEAKLVAWFGRHPDGYDFFRGRYHEALRAGPYMPALRDLAVLGQKEAITLLHQGENPNENTAAALHEFLSELQAYVEDEG